MGKLFSAAYKKFTPKQKQDVVNKAMTPSHFKHFSPPHQKRLRTASEFQQKGNDKQADAILTELFNHPQFRDRMSTVCKQVPNCPIIPEEQEEEVKQKEEVKQEEKTQPLQKFGEIVSALESDNPPRIILSLWAELHDLAKSKYDDENFDFLKDVIKFEKEWKHKVPKETDEKESNVYVDELNRMYTLYIKDEAKKEINLSSRKQKKLHNAYKNKWKDSNGKLLTPQQIWKVAKEDIISVVNKNTYYGFKKTWKQRHPKWRKEYEEWKSLEKAKLQNKAMQQQQQKQKKIALNIKGSKLFKKQQKQHANDKGGQAQYGDFGDDIYGQYDFYDSIISERDTGSGNTGYHYSPRYDSQNYGQQSPEYLVYPHYNQQIGEYNSGLINSNDWMFGVTMMMNICLFIVLLSSLCCICMLIYGFLVHKVIKSTQTISRKPYLRMAEEDSMTEV